MKIFLDDERIPQDARKHTGNDIYNQEDWILVRSFDEFKEYIQNTGLPELISFDHDLAHEHYKYCFSKHIPYSEFIVKTGYHCLLWLILFCNMNSKSLPQILIHTRNEQGKNNMINLCETYIMLALMKANPAK